MTSFLRHPSDPPQGEPPRGLTLVEMLVAMTLTLILMGAVTQIFGMLGQGINGSRTVAELNDRMRATAYRLRQDLAGITVDASVAPPTRAALNTGYLEVIEGPESDIVAYFGSPATAFDKSAGVYDAATNRWNGTADPYLSATGSDDRLVGDIDDVLLFTTRSTGEPFAGRVDTRNTNLEGGSVRSPFAEVAWFCRPSPNTSSPRTFTLYRRQRLIMAHPGAEPFVNTTAAGPSRNSFGGPPNTLPFTDWAGIYQLTDVSCRLQAGLAIPNTLGDLTRRENRFMHATGFPHAFPIPMYAAPADLANLTFDSVPNRMGEDVILTNVLAFDVRVFDPGAIVQAQLGLLATGNVQNPTRIAVAPGDPGYVVGGSDSNNAVGAFVDLNWTGAGPLGFTAALGPQPFAHAGRRVRNSAAGNTLPYPTYDTWTDYYEVNGLDDNGDGSIDEGSNGVDDNGINGIDEAGEQETQPPYPVLLSAIQIRLRCYEPSSKQVRQMTISQELAR
jgi:prepilin-type N-terminal cleavage/methylation domain-containing protein